MSIVHLDINGGGDAEEKTSAEAEFVAGLRTNSAEALERAYTFLGAESDEWARLRAEVLCEGEPASVLTDRLVGIQAEDGSLTRGTLISGGALGFAPFDAAQLTPRDEKFLGTLEALLIAGDAKVLHGAWVGGAAKFLSSEQAEDGSFGLEAPGAFAEDPERVTTFLTGMTAGILGRTPAARHSLLDAAGEYLATQFEPDAVEHDGYSAMLSYSHFFTNVMHDLSDEALQWCGRALEKGFRSRQLDAVATVRVLLTCDAQAMPGATFDVAELLDRLLSEQASDGGFAELCPDGPAARTTQTFDGMLAIVKLCAALEA